MPYDVVAFEHDELALKLTADAEGVFHRMLRKAWVNGSVPADLTELAYLCRINPRTMRKLWPQLASMWTPIPGNPTRIISKKLESERNFLENKRKSAQESANARWNKQKPNEIADANALQYSNASPPHPIPSHPNVSTIVDTQGDSVPVEKRGTRTPDASYELFASRHLEFTGTVYVHKKADFVQLAALKKANSLTSQQSPDRWEEAVQNYFGSPLAAYTLADLCTKFPVFRNSPTDRFHAPVNHRGNHNGHKTKADRTREATEEVLRRLDQQDRERGECGADSGDSGGLHGKTAAAKQ